MVLQTFNCDLVPSNDGAVLSRFCPWCECVHVAVLPPETRTGTLGETVEVLSGCEPGSPHYGGRVMLRPVRTVRSAELTEPVGPGLFRRTQGKRTKDRVTVADAVDAADLDLALVRAVFGAGRTRDGFTAKLEGGAEVEVSAGLESWLLLAADGHEITRGEALGNLLVRLTGVPIGVLMVRVAEAATGVRLRDDLRWSVAEILTRVLAEKPEVAA